MVVDEEGDNSSAASQESNAASSEEQDAVGAESADAAFFAAEKVYACYDIAYFRRLVEFVY